MFYDNFKEYEAEDSVVEDRILDKIEKELETLERGLQNYINEETSKEAQVSSFLETLSSNYTFDCLLSFNYSHCAEKLLKIESNKAFYIHGNVDTSIVLGIETNMISNQSISDDSNYSVFFKRYRRILKDTNRGFYNVISPKPYYLPKIGVYGHSLDLSDKSIFVKIFNLDAEYDIYCYEDITEYKKRLNRLIGLDRFDKLYSKNRINFIKIQNNNVKRDEQ